MMNNLLSLCIIKISDPSVRTDASTHVVIDKQHHFGSARILDVITEYANSVMFHMSVANDNSFDDHWEIDFTDLTGESIRKIYLNMRSVSTEYSEWEIWVRMEDADQVFYDNLKKFACTQAVQNPNPETR